MTKKIKHKYDIGTHLMGITGSGFKLVHGNVKEIKISEFLKEVLYVLQTMDGKLLFNTIVFEKDVILYDKSTWLQLFDEYTKFLEYKKLADEYQKRIKQLLSGENYVA